MALTIARFVGFDWISQGTWWPHRGKIGYYRSQEASPVLVSSLPPGMSATTADLILYNWGDNDTDVRQCQSCDGAHRSGAIWYSGGSSGSFTFTVRDAATRRFSVYCADLTYSGRTQTLAVSDAIDGTVLDTQSLAVFGQGVWTTWDISGSFTLTLTRGDGPYLVVSAILIDPPPRARSRLGLATVLDVVGGSTTPPALTAGTVYFDSGGPGGGGGTPFLKLTADDATGGTGPYTYQWQVSDNSGSYSDISDGSGTSGATTLTLTYAATELHTYQFKLVYTDSTEASIASIPTTYLVVYTGGTITIQSGRGQRGILTGGGF